jgi:protein phosphatase
MSSVDAEHAPEPAVGRADVGPGDRLLLCSDGLSDLVDEARIASLLQTRDPDDAAAALVHAALEEGGRDNVTCLVADVTDGPPVCGDGRLLGAMRDPFLVVDAAAVRLDSPA